MITSNAGPVSAGLPRKRNVIADCGAQGPMPQQDSADCHGHEMYPQKFVRLVGCHESNAGKHEGEHRSH
jgi:hypothetical protein